MAGRLALQALLMVAVAPRKEASISLQGQKVGLAALQMANAYEIIIQQMRARRLHGPTALHGISAMEEGRLTLVTRSTFHHHMTAVPFSSPHDDKTTTTGRKLSVQQQ